MVGRIWRTLIDPSRSDEYRAFAASRSIPMFEAHEGFQGVIFGENGHERLVITLWETQDAIDDLERSQLYRQTVSTIEATGFLSGTQSVETFEIDVLLVPRH